MWIKIEIGDISFNLSLGYKIKKKTNKVKTESFEVKNKSNNYLSLVLNKNLKHLNFIDSLEMNYSENQLKSLPYLQELKDVKLEAQKNILALFNNKVA